MHLNLSRTPVVFRARSTFGHNPIGPLEEPDKVIASATQAKQTVGIAQNTDKSSTNYGKVFLLPAAILGQVIQGVGWFIMRLIVNGEEKASPKKGERVQLPEDSSFAE